MRGRRVHAYVLRRVFLAPTPFDMCFCVRCAALPSFAVLALRQLFATLQRRCCATVRDGRSTARVSSLRILLSTTLPTEKLDFWLSLLTSSFRSHVRGLLCSGVGWGGEGRGEMVGSCCCEHLTCRVAAYRVSVLTNCPSPSRCSGAVLH